MREKALYDGREITTGVPGKLLYLDRFDRNAGEPVYQHAWDRRWHRARRGAGSREPADRDDDAASPLDDLPDAGAAVPGPLTPADGAAGQEEQRPGRDADDTAVAGAPAAPDGTLWTPEPRAALEGLMPRTARRA